MKTDLSRNTFDPAKRYSSVRRKQGAMDVDADWNEEIDILARREALTVGDIVGPAGAPEGADGFRLVATAAGLTPDEAARPGNAPVPGPVAGDVLLTAGRAYVQGLLVENPAITTLATQPDLPGAGVLPGPGVHLAYLDVWERSVTSLEDPAIREVALGGPDTATRTRRVWQVRTVRVGDSGTALTCGDSLAAYDAAIAPPTGRLAARAEPDAAASGPCAVPEEAGYRSLENQLYRVECRRAGNRATARFVWSRENGSVVTGWIGQNGPELTVSSPGPDRAHGFANGDWVELIDAGRELRAEPGTLVRVLTVRGDVLVIDPATADGPTAFAQFPVQPRIRRWDGDGAFAANGDAWVGLEQGVQVRFEAGTFRVGDYWMFPARTNTADIEWPRDGGGLPLAQAPMGIAHAYARLALLDFNGATVTATDCRALFPPLTGLTQIDYVGGDGQEAMPDLTQPAAGVNLPEPLQVAVSRGSTPVAGARVRFTVTSGGGRVNGAATSDVITDAAGLATAAWRLGTVGQAQRAEARLIFPPASPRHVPVRFSAGFSTAAQVAFDPASACPELAEARTVQRAIEILCLNSGGAEPGFNIVKMTWAANGQPYDHDGTIDLDTMMGGLILSCDDIVDPLSVLERPVVFVSVLGRSGSVDARAALGRYRLQAKLEVAQEAIIWRPMPEIAEFTGRLLEGLERPLFELTVRGGNIRAASPAEDGTPRWLDAEGLEHPGARILPTGDRRHGGTLVSWFWLGRQPSPGIGFLDVARGRGGLLTGRVVELADGKGIPGLTVTTDTLTGGPGRTAATDADGAFSFESVPATALVLRTVADGRQAATTVPPQRLIANPFRPTDFRTATVTEIPGLNRAMLARLARANLDVPAIVANLDAPELALRLGVSEDVAAGVLTTIRAAAVRPG
ncbi:DUF6519 domain-containing protein [Paracoccaceae bacterium Fryx2]|nr:DUF6519 domain-containing protein [Paracoccaceae bacterium Fryx2]